MMLTRIQIDHILKVYEEVGPDAARELAPRYGVRPTYVRKLASKHGVKAKRKGPRLYRRIPDHLDPRWKWAEQRGVVTV
jgi:hypothetical protein